jgi:hypothetical protein
MPGTGADRHRQETIWLYDVPGGYHDMRCICPRHCGNCFEDLSGLVERSVISPRERYCSDYCRNRAKRERALDRALAGGGR